MSGIEKEILNKYIHLYPYYTEIQFDLNFFTSSYIRQEGLGMIIIRHVIKHIWIYMHKIIYSYIRPYQIISYMAYSKDIIPFIMSKLL